MADRDVIAFFDLFSWTHHRCCCLQEQGRKFNTLQDELRSEGLAAAKAHFANIFRKEVVVRKLLDAGGTAGFMCSAFQVGVHASHSSLAPMLLTALTLRKQGGMINWSPDRASGYAFNASICSIFVPLRAQMLFKAEGLAASSSDRIQKLRLLEETVKSKRSRKLELKRAEQAKRKLLERSAGLSGR